MFRKIRELGWRAVVGGLFAAGLLFVAAAGLAQTVLLPAERSEYENRYAHKIDAPTLAGYLSGSFQESVDNALGDQVTLSTTFKKAYARLSTAILDLAGRPFRESEYLAERYIRADQALLFGPEHLVYAPYDAARKDELTARAAQLSALIAAHPEVKFSLYYIEKDTDLHFETGEKPGFYEALRQGVTLPEERMDGFTIDCFEEFSEFFYRTDHHWNAAGAARGYREVLQILECEDAPREVTAEVTLAGRMCGSKALSYGLMREEDVTLYAYALPELRVWINGAPAEAYGRQAAFRNGAKDPPSYSLIYGEDDGEVILSTGDPERENLLILGESYDNAILNLVASHYQNTYAVDLRYYEALMGEPFRFSDYLAEHEIHRVLFIGNIDYFLMPDFLVEG
ncbi:MAG: hypothetical protein E7458_05690 [Ruminococcaceae bacterium]|nr:hypothetical protein [Oscillospiraceae bacterium]